MKCLIVFAALSVLMNPLSSVSAQQEDLLVLYTFKEGQGDSLKDTSEVDPPLDLTVNTRANVKWIAGGGLTIEKPALFASDAPATKIIEACKASNEITIEAWIQPANRENAGPARIVTLSANPSNRNFTFGQDTTGYQIRLRTTTTGNNGVNPALPVPDAVETNQISKLVYARDAGEQARFYIDGEEVAQAEISGNFSNWDDNYKFGLGHELDLADDLGRAYIGDYFLVAVYSRAYTPDQLPDLLPVEPKGKLAAVWGQIKVSR